MCWRIFDYFCIWRVLAVRSWRIFQLLNGTRRRVWRPIADIFELAIWRVRLDFRIQFVIWRTSRKDLMHVGQSLMLINFTISIANHNCRLLVLLHIVRIGRMVLNRFRSMRTQNANRVGWIIVKDCFVESRSFHFSCYASVLLRFGNYIVIKSTLQSIDIEYSRLRRVKNSFSVSWNSLGFSGFSAFARVVVVHLN